MSYSAWIILFNPSLFYFINHIFIEDFRGRYKGKKAIYIFYWNVEGTMSIVIVKKNIRDKSK